MCLALSHVGSAGPRCEQLLVNRPNSSGLGALPGQGWCLCQGPRQGPWEKAVLLWLICRTLSPCQPPAMFACLEISWELGLGVPTTRKLEQLVIACGADRLFLKDKRRMVITTKENGQHPVPTGELFLAGPVRITEMNGNRHGSRSP